MTLTGIRSLVRHILRESLEDVVEVELRIRIKASSRSIADILTDIRGIRNVITVSQSSSQDAEDGKTRLLVTLKFEDDEQATLEDLEGEIKAIPEVDLITVVSYDGVPMRRVS